MSRKKELIKFISALIIVLSATYYIGGCMFNGFNKTYLQNADECSSEIINAYGVLLPSNTKVEEVNMYHYMNMHYCVAKIEYVDVDIIKALNQNNTKAINIHSQNEKNYAVIDSYSELKNFVLYENLRYKPKGLSVSLFYDNEHLYLSVDLESPFGAELKHLFQKAEKEGRLNK